MRPRSRPGPALSPFLLLLVLLTGVPWLQGSAAAQVRERVGDAAKAEAEAEAARQATRAVRAAIRCVVGDVVCQRKAREEGKDVVVVDEQGNPVDGAGAAPPSEDRPPAAPRAPDAATPAEADERVLFYEDFADEEVGSFPSRLEVVRGNWDVVERDGRRLLRNTGPRHSAVRIPLPEPLPERFTIEFPVLLYEGNANLALSLSPPDRGEEHRYRIHYYTHNYVDVGSWGVGVTSRDPNDPKMTERVGNALTTGLAPIRVAADGSQVEVYVGERQVASVPSADLVRADTLWLENTYAASAEKPILIGPIRVVAGGGDR